MIKLVKNFLNKKELKKTFEYFDYSLFKKSNIFNNEGENGQVPNSEYIYNNLVANYIMLTKLKTVEKHFGEELLPTYTYTRHYTRGMELKKHKDRAACEMSLTLNIWQDEKWPIYFEKDNKKIKVLTNPGEMALYEGCIYPHWRDKYKGESCLQIFIHYVRKNGNNKNQYLDSLGHLDYPKEIYNKWLK
jgi:hypothetical protein